MRPIALYSGDYTDLQGKIPQLGIPATVELVNSLFPMNTSLQTTQDRLSPSIDFLLDEIDTLTTVPPKPQYVPHKRSTLQTLNQKPQ